MKKQYNFKNTSEFNDSLPLIIDLNNKIDSIYTIIFNNFKVNMVSYRYEFKKEVFTSLIFNNSSLGIKKIKVDIEVVEKLTKFLRHSCEIAANKGSGGAHKFFNRDNYNIFKETLIDVNEELQNKDNIFSKNVQKKITIYIDIKFLKDIKSFNEKYKYNELKNNSKTDDDIITRCDVCSAIVPKLFVSMNSDPKKNLIIKRFFLKGIKNWRYTSVFRLNKFPKDQNIDNIDKLSECLNVIISDKNMDNNIHDSAKKINMQLEDQLGRLGEGFSKEIFNSFTRDIIKHIKYQIKHFNKLNKMGKIINDINDAEEDYFNKSTSYLNDVNNSLNSLIKITDLRFTLPEKCEEDKLKAELTMNNKKPSEFDYDKIELLKFQPIVISKNDIERYFILSQMPEDENFSTKDLTKVTITSNKSTNSSGKFDFQFLKNSELIQSFSMEFDEFIYHLVNSSCVSTILKKDVKIKLIPLLLLLNENLGFTKNKFYI